MTCMHMSTRWHFQQLILVTRLNKSRTSNDLLLYLINAFFMVQLYARGNILNIYKKKGILMVIEQKRKISQKLQLRVYDYQYSSINNDPIQCGSNSLQLIEFFFFAYCLSCFFNSFTFYIAILLLPFLFYSWTTWCLIDAANNIYSSWWSWLVDPMPLLLSFHASIAIMGHCLYD